jgi:hypothetical protein
MDVYMRNPLTGAKKRARTGFSWTSLLFGFWVPLFRGDWKWTAILLPSYLVLAFLTLGLGNLVLGIVQGAKYNEWHLDGLRESGYAPVTHDEYYDLRPAAVA